MSLTVRLKNIGILKQAEFSLGDLTIICGENNTGKTYTACALYGFLQSWRQFIRFPISDVQIQRALTKQVKIELEQATDDMLTEASKKYTKQLDKIFAAAEGSFQNSEFCVVTDKIDIRDKKFNSLLTNPQNPAFIFAKGEGSKEAILAAEIKGEHEREIDTDSVKSAIDFIIITDIFSDSFPRPFIASAERTGISTFRKELNFARSQLLKEMERTDPQIDLREFLSKAYQRYPSPIETDVDFMGQLQEVAKSKSFIAKAHPEVLEDFTDIVGGTYAITQNDLLYYIPKGTRLRLTMDQSSSAVRSLLDLNFYLHCAAEKGDLLMIDEPELSLHPENQRRIARLFARLVNLGVKVFITTHSDYIVKELNTLIMLNHDKPHLKKVAKENGCQDSELINADQVKVYVAEKALLPLEEGQKRRKRGHTLLQADIDPEFGIEVGSFDKTIDAMNKIQRDIVWGAKSD
ncbi:MAG: ATP-binding protein [Candidatus Poribacteria bacterium]|nr:ATP-binding protein [Candidatus Poribacteria bacterium]